MLKYFTIRITSPVTVMTLLMDEYYRQIRHADATGGPWPDLPPLPPTDEQNVVLGEEVEEKKIYYHADARGRPIWHSGAWPGDGGDGQSDLPLEGRGDGHNRVKGSRAKLGKSREKT